MSTPDPRRIAALAATALPLAASAALAQTAQHGHPAMPSPQVIPRGDVGEGRQGAPGGGAMAQHRPEMRQAVETMNRDMIGAPMTGDPDRDLAAMMIPHHQGAIDMARAYLREGKDPQMRRMAEGAIGVREAEIRAMREWMAEHPAR